MVEKFFKGTLITNKDIGFKTLKENVITEKEIRMVSKIEKINTHQRYKIQEYWLQKFSLNIHL